MHMQMKNCIKYITIVCGEGQGQKIIVKDGEVIYKSTNSDYLSGICDELKNENGLIEKDDRLIFIQNKSERSKLVIAGAGHVAKAVVQLASNLDFDIYVIDDRKELLDELSVYENVSVISDDYPDGLQKVPESSNNYYICMTRGHEYDIDSLKVMLRAKGRYVGLMSSKTRAESVKRSLVQEGLSQQLADSIHAPIGLSISAHTPYEIAVSIMAEIIQCKNSLVETGSGSRDVNEYVERYFGITEDAVDITAREELKKAVLCTIVRKRGSAPRSVGTQMIVTSKSIIGTIGGGMFEADIINKCQEMIAGNIACKLFEESVTTADVVDGGMLCGGRVTVYCEVL